MDYTKSFSEAFDLAEYVIGQTVLSNLKDTFPYLLTAGITFLFCYIIYALWKRKKRVNQYITNGVYVRIDIAELSSYKQVMQSLLRGMSQLLFPVFGKKHYFSLEVIMSEKESKVYTLIPDQILADYIDLVKRCGCTAVILKDFRERVIEKASDLGLLVELELESDFVFPLELLHTSEKKLEKLFQAGECGYMQILCRPAGEKWKDDLKKYVTALKLGKNPSGSSTGCSGGCLSVTLPFFEAVANVITFMVHGTGVHPAKTTPLPKNESTDKVDQISQKMAEYAFEVVIRLVVQSPDEEHRYYLLDQLLDVLSARKSSITNTLTVSTFFQKIKSGMTNDLVLAYMPGKSVDILTDKELVDIINLVDF